MENKSNFHCSNFFLLYNELLGPQSLHCLSSSLISSLLIKNFISIGNVITKKRTNHCASIEFISIYLSNITSVKMIQVVISHRSFDSFHKLMKLMQMCANKCKCGILNAFLDDQRMLTLIFVCDLRYIRTIPNLYHTSSKQYIILSQLLRQVGKLSSLHISKMSEL